MPPRMNCPVCGSDMRSRSLLSYYSLKPYRVCPDCQAKYTSDPKTRRRQLGILVLALAVFGFTVAAALKGWVWVLPAVLSHIAFWGYFGYVLSRISYAPYEE